MLKVFVAAWLSLPMPADVADAILDCWVISEQPLPETIRPEFADAVQRFWRREQLWNPDYPVRDIRAEIVWLRSHWPTIELPRIEEADRLPAEPERMFWRQVCERMRCDLERMADCVPEWNAGAIAIQRAELDSCLCFWDAVWRARNGDNWISRREALREIREAIGERAWLIGDWPTCPWWRIAAR